MSDLPPALVLIEAARRVRDTRVEVENGNPVPADEWLRELWDAGLLRQHFTPAYKRIPDWYVLTEDGERWLAAAETERGL